jgi:hypothetical protein
MPPKKSKPVTAAIDVAPAEVDRRIYVIRGVRVMVDAELAQLYGVETRVINQAVERNPQRFPEDFCFQLTELELGDFNSRTGTGGPSYGGRRYRPRVFTEQGIAMLSSVLRSETAVRVNIEIMRGFVRLRRLLATPGELVTQLQQLAETVKLHDSQIKTIIDVLQKMVAPPADNSPKRRIGFIDAENESPNEEKK